MGKEFILCSSIRLKICFLCRKEIFYPQSIAQRDWTLEDSGYTYNDCGMIWWRTINKDIHEYVKTCDDCQKMTHIPKD